MIELILIRHAHAGPYTSPDEARKLSNSINTVEKLTKKRMYDKFIIIKFISSANNNY